MLGDELVTLKREMNALRKERDLAKAQQVLTVYSQGASQGAGQGTSQGAGQGASQGAGQGASQGAGQGASQGAGQMTGGRSGDRVQVR